MILASEMMIFSKIQENAENELVKNDQKICYKQKYKYLVFSSRLDGSPVLQNG